MAGFGKLFLLLGLLLVMPGLLLSQSLLDTEASMEQLQFDELEFLTNLSESNKVILSQFGVENQALINQSESTYSLIHSHMIGSNSLEISQNGDHIFSYSYQRGSDNLIDLDLRGSRIYTGIGQVGENNSVVLELSGKNLAYGIVQDGSNHRIEFKNSASNELALGYNSRLIRIRQTGYAAKLIIR